MTKDETLFEIQLTGLPVGEHHYSFTISRDLFETFENEEIQNATIEAFVNLEVRPNVRELHMKLNGNVDVLCDRCLGSLSLDIDQNEHAIVKPMGERSEDDLNILDYDDSTGVLSLDQYIYDMVLTGLPMQKVHPDDEDGQPTCDESMMVLIEKNEENSTNEIDPRWDQLRNLI